MVLTDVLAPQGEALARELGKSALFQQHDVASEADWQKVLAATLARFGGVDVLVNNAGILMMRGLLDTSKQDFERVLGINLVGTFLGIKAVAPKMIERGAGSIINISSVDGLKGSNAVSAYSASKWGMRGLTKVSAMELSPRGIRVNSVHPGGIATPDDDARRPDPRDGRGDAQVLQDLPARARRPARGSRARVACSWPATTPPT